MIKHILLALASLVLVTSCTSGSGKKQKMTSHKGAQVKKLANMKKHDSAKKSDCAAKKMEMLKAFKSVGTINFDFNKANLDGKSENNLKGKEYLTKQAAFLNKYKNLHVKITGHTDMKGSDSINHKISDQRARYVAKQLASKGVDPKRIVIDAQGSKKRVVMNEGKELQNRRTVTEIMKW